MGIEFNQFRTGLFVGHFEQGLHKKTSNLLII